MATYRLMDGVSGRPGVGSSGTQPPTSPNAYTGSFQAGLDFVVTQGGMWFEGYYWWVPPGGDTGAQQFALWSLDSISSANFVLVPGTTVTSGTLTAGAFNYIPLSTPVPLSIGASGQFAGGLFVAATGWTSVNGFPVTNNQFGTGQPYVNGITSGPLFGAGAGTNQGIVANCSTFSTAANNATGNCPVGQSGNANFWLDVAVSDTAPAGYSGSYRLYPNRNGPNLQTSADSAVNYAVATEIHLSQTCTLDNIWYYSPAGTAQLATRAGVYSILGTNSGTEVAAITSPSWSGAAASGWVAAAFPGGLTLPAGSYKPYVYNAAASPDQWSSKDASTAYWTTGGEGVNGITNGPVYAPNLSSASVAYEYNASNPGGSPPYNNSGLTEPGQCTFYQPPGTAPTIPPYPYLYVDGLAQNYWVDLEVTPVPQAAAQQSPQIRYMSRRVG